MGGIWVLWNPDVVSIITFQMTTQVIHLVVTRSNYEQWLFFAVYASLFPRSRYNNFCDDIVDINRNNQKLWLMTRDFNNHANNSEECSFSAHNSSDSGKSKKIIEYMEKCDLMDLVCTRP